MSTGQIITRLMGEEIWLLPEKALYWPEKSMLMVSDLHLGKALHFRKAGIAMPRNSNDRDLEKLGGLVRKFQPAQLVFLGDLFHSDHNQDWEVFGEFLQQFPRTRHILVQGNHDVLKKHHYRRFGIALHVGSLLERPFYLTHHPQEEVPDGWYNLAGHIHPGVRLSGRGNQSLKLPCFWFKSDRGILPAFGHLTGLGRVRPGEEDQVFVIAEEEVIQVQ